MTLTILADPATRGCLFREVRALCAGDSCDVAVEGVRGADASTLALALRRPGGTLLATASGFAPSALDPAVLESTLSLATDPLSRWYREAVRDESDGDGCAPARLVAGARLEIFDAARTWVACDVPLVLRDLDGMSLVPAISGLLPPSMRLVDVNDLFAAVKALLVAARVSVEEEESHV